MTSLRQFDRPADRIRQHRQVSRAPLIIVEGPDDVFVLKPHLEGTDFFPVAGKPNVIETARALLAAGVERFACITDCDFDDPAEVADIASVHYPYAESDLESMLIELGVLAHVLESQASRDKLASQGGADSIVVHIRQAVAPVSSLRMASRAASWGLRFDAVNLASKTDRRTLQIDILGYCTALRAASESAVPLIELTRVAQAANCRDRYRGRDVVCIAGVALRWLIGSLQQAACAEPVLVAQLHSSGAFALSRSAWLVGLKDRLALAS